MRLRRATHHRGSEPGDALAHGPAAVAGSHLGFTRGAGAGQTGVQKAESEAEQGAGEHDIDEAHGILQIRDFPAALAALFAAATVAQFGRIRCFAGNSPQESWQLGRPIKNVFIIRRRSAFSALDTGHASPA
jgi:hypothetical protein